MSCWQPIETAPRGDVPFLALDACGEVFVAKYTEDGRLCYRMHDLRIGEKYRIIDAVMDGQPVKARVPIEQPWAENFAHDWVLWTKGFDFQPTRWAELTRPDGEQS